MTYDLCEKVPTTDNSIVYVVGMNYHFVSYGVHLDLTWKELLEKSIINRKEKHGSCLLVVIEPLNGHVFQFGNYDRDVVYDFGKTKGYA